MKRSRLRFCLEGLVTLTLAVPVVLTLACSGGDGGSASLTSPTEPMPPMAASDWSLALTAAVRNTDPTTPTLVEASLWIDGEKIRSAECDLTAPCSSIAVHTNTVESSGQHRIELKVDRQTSSPTDYGAGGGASNWVATEASGSGRIQRGSLADKRDLSLDTGEGFVWTIQFG